jgi:hypothetical protein
MTDSCDISVYLNDNAFVEGILYEKKNGYFPFFLFSERMLFFPVENSVYERIIVEINATHLRFSDKRVAAKEIVRRE